jgi:uncharacterized repeat protein (TIGR03847 family)
MPNRELELNPVDFITIGTVGPKGQRVFHLQAGKDGEIITLIIEKEQADALGKAISELLEDLQTRFPERGEITTDANTNFDLRDPVEPLFRVAQMGLGYDEDRDLIVLVAQEYVTNTPEDDEIESDEEAIQPSVVRLWSSRAQMKALSDHSSATVQAGRPDPRLNGRLIYYWT